MDASTAPVMHSGWVLKKKKKKMQGRHFLIADRRLREALADYI
jgi:hypothetical protein